MFDRLRARATAVGNSREEADALYRRAERIVLDEAGVALTDDALPVL